MAKPEELGDWKQIERELLEIGIPRYKAWQEIGIFYNTTYHKARYWLDEGRRTRGRRRDDKEYQRKYKRFVRHLDEHLENSLSPGEVYDLGEISKELSKSAERSDKVNRPIELKESTLEKKIDNLDKQLLALRDDNKYEYVGNGNQE